MVVLSALCITISSWSHWLGKVLLVLSISLTGECHGLCDSHSVMLKGQLCFQPRLSQMVVARGSLTCHCHLLYECGFTTSVLGVRG